MPSSLGVRCARPRCRACALAHRLCLTVAAVIAFAVAPATAGATSAPTATIVFTVPPGLSGSAGLGTQAGVFSTPEVGGPPRTTTLQPGAIYMGPPTVSPDGLTVIYESDWQLWSVNQDGSNRHQLTSAGKNYEPSWSPDGTSIVFASDRTGSRNLWLMNPDGTNQRQLTTNAVAPTTDAQPAWSPDGASIAFVQGQGTAWSGQIRVLDVATGAIRTVVGYDDNNERPAWSPDGQTLAFTNLTNTESIWTVPASGGTPRQVSTRRGYNETWTPDGESLIYEDWADGTLRRLNLATGATSPIPGTVNAMYPVVTLSFPATPCLDPPDPYTTEDGAPKDKYCPIADDQPSGPQDNPEVDPEFAGEIAEATQDDVASGNVNSDKKACCGDTVTESGGYPVFLCNSTTYTRHLGADWCDSVYRQGRRWARSLYYSERTHRGGGLRGGTRPSTLYGCFRFWSQTYKSVVKKVCHDTHATTGYLRHRARNHNNWVGDALHFGRKRWIWGGFWDEK
jgi:hypothetical protein